MPPSGPKKRKNMPNYFQNAFLTHLASLFIHGTIESFGSLYYYNVHGFGVVPQQMTRCSTASTSSHMAMDGSPPASVQCKSKTKLYSASSFPKRVNEISSSTSMITPTCTGSTSYCDSFTTESTEVWVEDTDAYGIMYNGNYLRSYERALLQLYPKHLNSDGNNDDWHITKVTRHKFKSSPVLGDTFVIKGKKVLVEGGGNETWELQMLKEDSSNAMGEEEVIFNIATVTLKNLSVDLDDNDDSVALLNVPSDSDQLFEKSFKTYRDEFDSFTYGENGRKEDNDDNVSISTGGGDLFPLRSVLNLFERARSSRLGGPAMLQKIQSDGLLWVVTSIDDLELDLAGVMSQVVRPGQYMITYSDANVKRRGMYFQSQVTSSKIIPNFIDSRFFIFILLLL